MLMRAPGEFGEPFVHEAQPNYAQIFTSSVDAAVPFSLAGITPEDLASVAPNDTHDHYVAGLRAKEKAKASWMLGAIASLPLAVGTLAAIDHEYIAPVVWGSHTASYEQVAANRYAFDGTGTITLAATGMSAQRDTAKEIAGSVRPAVSDNIPNSKLMALELGSRLYMRDIFDGFDSMMAENNPGKLVFVLPSAAGKYGLDIAAYSSEHYPQVQLTIVLIDTPYNQESAFDLRDNATLRMFADAMHEQERFVGPLGNVAFDLLGDETNQKYRDYGCVQYFVAQDSQEWRYACPVEPRHVRGEIGRVNRDILSRQGSPIGLRADLAATVMDNSVPGNLSTIAANTTKPVILAYIASRRDTVVDVQLSINEFRDAAVKQGFTFLSLNVNATHAGINDSQEYLPAIREILAHAQETLATPSNFSDVANTYDQAGPGF
ncbi:MAG: hypothetical protein WBP26_02470 [Candidatus Saccharimonadales bacterium]